MTVRNQKHYEQLFKDYPDIVTLDEFRTMLGGIGDRTGRKLISENHEKYFYIHDTYMIPKAWVIEYVLSDHYAEYRQKLNVQI